MKNLELQSTNKTEIEKEKKWKKDMRILGCRAQANHDTLIKHKNREHL